MPLFDNLPLAQLRVRPLKRGVRLLPNLGRMKLTLHSFKFDVTREKICQPGVEYEVSESDVGANEAFAFFDRLIYPRDSFYLKT